MQVYPLCMFAHIDPDPALQHFGCLISRFVTGKICVGLFKNHLTYNGRLNTATRKMPAALSGSRHRIIKRSLLVYGVTYIFMLSISPAVSYALSPTSPVWNVSVIHCPAYAEISKDFETHVVS